MFWMLRESSFIPLGLFHYFNAGVTRDEALAYLLKSNEKNPKYFPRIDYREIDFWYNSFQSGNFDFKQEPTYPDLSKLENLPVLDHILHNVNTEDQKSLRKVCTKFKSVIDTENRLYDEIQILLATNSISLQVKNGIDKKTTKTIYTQKGDGCEFKAGKTTTLSDDSFLKKALSDFKTTIEKVNTKVKKLIVMHKETVSESIRNEFLDGITTVLKGLKSKLHVEILELTVDTPNHLNGILGEIKETSLTWLEVNVSNHAGNVFRLSNATNFSIHLSHLQTFFFNYFKVDIKLESIAHIPHVAVAFESMTVEDISNYKKRLLQFPNVTSHSFEDIGMIPPALVDNFRNGLTPFDSADEFEEDMMETVLLSGKFSVPGDSEDTIVFIISNFTINFSNKRFALDG